MSTLRTPRRRDATREGPLLRAALYVGGVVATAAGMQTVLKGARSVPGIDEHADPVVESELRFYSAFYVGYGVLMLALAARPERDPADVRGLAGMLFFAGVARLAGWHAVGRPNRAQLALLAIELGTPPLIARQATVASNALR